MPYMKQTVAWPGVEAIDGEPKWIEDNRIQKLSNRGWVIVKDQEKDQDDQKENQGES